MLPDVSTFPNSILTTYGGTLSGEYASLEISPALTLFSLIFALVMWYYYYGD
jgi:hypothetical protein